VTVLIVTGTGTDVGKTVATAAIAACAKGTVAVVKPAQTGLASGEPGDLAEVSRLSGVADTYEFARYPDPLSPHHAAQVSGLPELDYADAVRRIDDLAGQYDLVLVEGAGGLLVPFDSVKRWTLIDLAADLHCEFVIVTLPGLGTLNHTTLTIDRLSDESLDIAGLIIGTWPDEPDLAMRCALPDLRRMGRRRALGGVLPAGMSAMRDFRGTARKALAPEFGGTFDSRAFVAQYLL
jgi:dethiobiotin synthetase